MYPRLEIDIDKLRTNARVVSQICKAQNLDVCMVTKSYCAIPEVVGELVKEGIDFVADSRICNLKKLRDIDAKKVLLRIPMISEVCDVVDFVDISFNSELKTISALNDAAKAKNKVQDIVVMVDLGDLREGYFSSEDLLDAVREILDFDNISLVGIATNLTCYGAIIPSTVNLGRLSRLASDIESKFDIKLSFVSGGNSSSFHLLDTNSMPDNITNLRPGEAIILGVETAYGKPIEGTHQDAFKLVCEIVELKKKPSMPIGESGVDAFGNKPTFEDRGIRKRAIVAIGRQDIDIDGLCPYDENVFILGASSDHMIIDVTDSDVCYGIGDKLEFALSYSGVMSASTSEYVFKKVVNEAVLA